MLVCKGEAYPQAPQIDIPRRPFGGCVVALTEVVTVGGSTPDAEAVKNNMIEAHSNPTLSARIDDSLGENRVGSNRRCRCAAMRGLGATIPNCVPPGAAFLLIRHT